MRPRRYTTISREGWYYLLLVALIFGGALVRQVNLLLMLAGMLAGPLLLSRFMAVITLRGLTVRRKVPQGICAGDLLVASVTVNNPRRGLGSWAIVVEEPVRREGNGGPVGINKFPSVVGRAFQLVRKNGRARKLVLQSAADASVYFPYIPAGESRKGVYRGRLTERGRYRLGPLRISTRFPFGLFGHTIALGSTAVVTVLPRLGRLARGWVARHHESFAGTDRRERRAGVEGDFYGVRPWRAGDSRRWIHWRTSARAGKLMVRQFEQPRNRDVAVLVDLWQPEQPAIEHRENVELAVSFAATIVAELCRKGGSEVYLGLGAGETRLNGGPASAALLQEMLERLALAEPAPHDGTADLLEQALGQLDAGTQIVLVSTRPVDLADTARFGRLWSDPARQAALRRIRVVDTSSEALSQYFEVDN